MFTLTHQYKYTLTELENMIPRERDMYIGMVNSWAKEESERIKQQADQQKQDLRSIFKKSKKR